MIAIYFSSTGNTKHCVKKFIEYLGGDIAAVSIEDENCGELLRKQSEIILAYPVYFSDLPKIVREFICKNRDSFKNKHVFIISTMEFFSGDGSGCAARILKKFGADIIGAAHIKMPGFILDVGIFRYFSEKNERIIKSADEKIKKLANDFCSGDFPHEGLSVFNQIAGLLGQRL